MHKIIKSNHHLTLPKPPLTHVPKSYSHISNIYEDGYHTTSTVWVATHPIQTCPGITWGPYLISYLLTLQKRDWHLHCCNFLSSSFRHQSRLPSPSRSPCWTAQIPSAAPQLHLTLHPLFGQSKNSSWTNMQLTVRSFFIENRTTVKPLHIIFNSLNDKAMGIVEKWCIHYYQSFLKSTISAF